MNKNKIPRNYCFLDLETTGFDPELDSIIEMSFIVRNQKGQEITRMDEVVFPDKSKLTPFVSNLTGITQEEINQSGKKFVDLISEAKEKIGDAVIIGHNIDFDINFLIANGMENLAENPRIDTHELARIVLPNEDSYALEVLSNKYKMAHENAHRAMSDVEANILFFDFLVEKIDQIPAKFLEEVHPVLKSKTDWFAKNIFLAAIGSKEILRKNENKEVHKIKVNLDIPEDFWNKVSEITPANSLFIKQTDSLKSAELTKRIAEKQKKSLIITSKLNYFSEIKQFPSPNVILDSEKLNNFAKSRKNLNNAEISFWLQAKYREILGFRGKNFFNLFFQQRDYWEEICLNDKNHEIFQKIVSEKENIQTLAIAPQTFLQLIDLDVFKDRILLIDESEVFANDLLFSSARNWSLFPSLNSKKEKESTAAQFWVTNFCREVIEGKIQHTITPFPEKVLLNKAENFPVFANTLDEFESLMGRDELKKVLLNSREKTVRWATYFPKDGNLTIGSWHPDDWRELKNKLTKFSKIFFHRHDIDNSFSFFRIFVGANEGEVLNCSFIKNKISLIIPNNLISVKSPDFNDYTSNKIKEIFAEIPEKEILAGNFSSVETLKKVFYDLSDEMGENEKIYGESVSGGTPKILNLIKQNPAKKRLFLTKNVSTPEMSDLDIKKLVVQKFIFNPPQPLLEEIESVMKKSGLNFWSVWIMPQITANLSRVIGNFANLEEVVFLDARENSRWGKDVLRSLF